MKVHLNLLFIGECAKDFESAGSSVIQSKLKRIVINIGLTFKNNYPKTTEVYVHALHKELPEFSLQFKNVVVYSYRNESKNPFTEIYVSSILKGIYDIEHPLDRITFYSGIDVRLPTAITFGGKEFKNKASTLVLCGDRVVFDTARNRLFDFNVLQTNLVVSKDVANVLVDYPIKCRIFYTSTTTSSATSDLVECKHKTNRIPITKIIE